MTTLYGIMTRDFLGLFFPGPFQAGVLINQNFLSDEIAKNVAFIMKSLAIPPNTAKAERFEFPSYSNFQLIEPSPTARKIGESATLAVGPEKSYQQCIGQADFENGCISRAMEALDKTAWQRYYGLITFHSALQLK